MIAEPQVSQLSLQVATAGLALNFDTPSAPDREWNVLASALRSELRILLQNHGMNISEKASASINVHQLRGAKDLILVEVKGMAHSRSFIRNIVADHKAMALQIVSLATHVGSR